MRAEFFLAEAKDALQQASPAVAREYSRAYVQFAEGSLQREQGQHQNAYKNLKTAHESAKADGTRISPVIALEWGNLLWSSGQFAEALQVYTDGATRERLGAINADYLMRAHLAAAKCAIDLENYKVAERELRASEQLVRESEEVSELSEGYYFLYLGEYHLASGLDGPKGFDLVDTACEHFEQMDPPFHPGLLDGKIVITRYAVRLDEHKRMLLIIHKMLEEAEEHGCLEARGRLILLETAMWVSENPPLTLDFENLALRTNMINNPALLMQACANLFIYSLRYLKEPDQAFMMGRLHRLQSVLDKSCYQDLYEKYIESRYSWAVEGRLSKFLEAEEKLFDEDFDEEHDDDLESTS